MPIYEFVCHACGNQFEALVSIGREKEVSCLKCKSKELKKLFSSFGIGGGSNRLTSSSASCSSCAKTSCSSCR